MEKRLYQRIDTKIDAIIFVDKSEIEATINNFCEEGVEFIINKKYLEKDTKGAELSTIVDIENEVDRMIDKRCSIVNQIDNINDTDMYDILAKVYILGRDLKVIAIERGVTYRHISRLYKSAITEFERKYGSEYLK